VHCQSLGELRLVRSTMRILLEGNVESQVLGL
jgi:hypothetical protein